MIPSVAQPPLPPPLRGPAALPSGQRGRPEGAPWTFLVLGGAALVAVAAFGIGSVLVGATVLINLAFLAFFLRHVAFAAAAVRWAGDDLYDRVDVDLQYQPNVSVLVACHDEALVARALVQGLVALHYPRSRLEIILVDDGSTDGTGALLDELTVSESHIRVLHRLPGAGGGKSGALNDAAELARGEVVVVFDADHIPRRNVIGCLVRHFQDPRVDAVQGRCVIRNSVEARLARSIAIDYFSGYIVNEYGRQALFELPAYGGANCAVRASTLRELGGWNPASVTEDTDLTLRVLLTGGTIRYDIMAVDTEEGATTLRRFKTQRYRWARGHQQAWRDYRKAVLLSPHLSWASKLETIMFLLVYHVPVLCAISLLSAVLRVVGIGPSITVFEMLPLAALLFAGPFCELAVGLLVGRAPRRAAVSMVLMTPLFFVFMLVCTRAWIEGVLGRPYSWAKTARSSWSALPERRQLPERVDLDVSTGSR
ncbi:MAG: glycosyl transferase, family 2 [Frankiales bacterium]|nr:glycosyl transferase, family 2 [Frankiales bacterium]